LSPYRFFHVTTFTPQQLKEKVINLSSIINQANKRFVGERKPFSPFGRDAGGREGIQNEEPLTHLENNNKR
jgi:hypothetical protein